MESFETYIDQMKAELGKIIKNYPPFPPGSEKRVEFLRSFTAIRKQIDQLSFAPDYKQDLKITADSMKIPRPGDWKGVFGNRGSRPAIAGPQVFIDATGFNIPELSENAPDAEIRAAIESLQEAEKALAQKRSELATNTLSIQQFLEFNIKFNESFPGYPEVLKDSDMTEGIAENKSSELKQTLMLESAKGLTEDPSQLLELLN
jgi:hypothetical protein